jgi:O-antigen/teichoic acid export membrane protein
MIEKFKKLIAKGSDKGLARDSATIAVGQILRLGLQACYFVVIARTLGPDQYGAFVAITALAAVAAPFAGLGAPNILLKNVSRDAKLLPVYWGNGIALICTSGVLFTLGLLAVAPLIVRPGLWSALLMVCVADLILIRLVELASFAATALGRMGETARLNVYISLTRLIAIILLLLVDAKPTVRQWTVAYIAASVVCSLYALITTSRIAGISFELKRIKTELAEASYFAVGGAAATVYNDIDKSMMARLSDLTSTGIYGAAYRIIDVSMAPIRAMTAAAYPEFFRRGERGLQATEQYAFGLIKRAAVFGAMIFVGCLLGAGLIPYALGPGFRSSVEATRWLAVIPLLRCVHLFLADSLSGAGYQGLRTAVQVGIGGLNIWLNIILIPRWSWRGAAWASVLCDGALALAFLLILRCLGRMRSSAAVEYAGAVEKI